MIRTKKFSIVDQFNSVRIKYPALNAKIDKDKLIIQGTIRPTPRSVEYYFKVRYNLDTRPKVDILNPKLKINFKGEEIPHVHKRNELCLYYPKYREFNSTKLIADTILPWTTLWLYHYENWHITGAWKGGGIHIKL